MRRRSGSSPSAGAKAPALVLTLVVIPALYSLWQEARLPERDEV
ncbi:MAG: hypothetical protein ACYC6F_07280 [Longimicrobiales bacterium]